MVRPTSKGCQLTIKPYTLGIGDRFGQRRRAQLDAILSVGRRGIGVDPVWNKSNREHLLTKATPQDLRNETDADVKALHWTGFYYVDAA